MRWPEFLRRRIPAGPAAGAWTPGRVVGLFDGWPIPDGTASLVSVGAGRGDPRLAVTLLRVAGGETIAVKACLCDDCLATTDWPEWASRVRAGLNERANDAALFAAPGAAPRS